MVCIYSNIQPSLPIPYNPCNPIIFYAPYTPINSLLGVFPPPILPSEDFRVPCEERRDHTPQALWVIIHNLYNLYTIYLPYTLYTRRTSYLLLLTPLTPLNRPTPHTPLQYILIKQFERNIIFPVYGMFGMFGMYVYSVYNVV